MAPKGFLVLVFVPSPPRPCCRTGGKYGHCLAGQASIRQGSLKPVSNYLLRFAKKGSGRVWDCGIVGLWDAGGFLCSLPDRLQSRLEGLPIENCMHHCLSCELSLKLCRSSFVLDCSGLQQAKSPPGRGWLHMPVPHVVPACTNEMI